ncbi:MAG: PAS domain S-box protein, partial [Thermoleophilia bacterium]
DDTNRYLNHLLDSMAEGVYTTDLEDRFTYTNPVVTAITGYTKEELSGKPVIDLIPADEHAKLAAMIQRRREGIADEYEIDLICSDGRRITVGQRVTPLLKGTDVIGKIGVTTDITERRRLESDIREQNRRLNLMQSIIARGVSGLASGKAIRTMVQEVVETLGYDFCSIFMLSADGKTLEMVAQHGGPEQDHAALNSSGIHDLDNPGFRAAPPAQAFLTGKQVVIDPTDHEFDRLAEVARSLGSRAMVATPLEYGGKRLGALIVHFTVAHHFTDSELDFLQTVAAQVASIAGSARIFGQLVDSEQRYHELYDGAADWMYTLDEANIITNCNKTMALALGYDRVEMIGRHIDDYMTGVHFNEVMAGEGEPGAPQIYLAERNFQTREGQTIVISTHACAVPDPRRDGTLWQNTGRDITGSKEAQRRLNLLAAAVDNTHECVIITDLKGDIVSINNAGADAFGFTPDHMTGKHMSEIWSDDNSAGLNEKIFAETMKGGWEGQVLYQRRDGTNLPVFLSSARVDDENGDAIAVVGISRDVSDEQRLTAEILRRNRDLAVLNAVAAAVSGTQDLDETLKRSLDAIVNTMHYGGGAIFLLDRDSLLLTPKVNSDDIPVKMRDQVLAIPVGQGQTGQIAASGRPIFIDDYQNSEYRLSHMPADPDLVSVGGVPLVSKERVVGVLLVSTAVPHEFSDEEKTLLLAAGKTIGVAVDNAHLFEDIARAKSEWETTFDSMANGVSIHDLDFTIVRANKALAEMLGTTTDALTGRKCYEVFHHRMEPIEACPHQRAITTGGNVTIVAEEPALGRILTISADPLFDPAGEIVGIVHDVRDITEQENLRDQLGQSERLRALGEMAGGVAHDFNNFLTVIMGNTQLLLAGNDKSPDTTESLETILRAATDAAETVRRIQEFTRVRTTREFTSVDINQVINNAIEVARPRWRDESESRGVRIELKTDLADVPPVNGNKSELAEVVLNLLINAVDALPDGGEITVTSALNSQGRIEIVISDNGKGMDDELRRRVFDPFVSTKGP